MPTHSDIPFTADVAAPLGESMTLVWHRGFHEERPIPDSEPLPAPTGRSPVMLEPDDHVDLVDLAVYAVDWDAIDDRWIHRRCRMSAIRRRAAGPRPATSSTAVVVPVAPAAARAVGVFIPPNP